MSSTISALDTASNLVTIYIGIPVLILGGILNLIVFLSLKTFRQNSCTLTIKKIYSKENNDFNSCN